MLSSAQTDRVMAAAQAAQQVKHACTINEAELLALRPTLLRGYASLQDNSRLAGCTLDNTGSRCCGPFLLQICGSTSYRWLLASS